MPQLFEDDQAAARDIGLEALGIGRRNQAIAPAPENQRRLPHLADQGLAVARRCLLEALHQSLTITSPQGQLVIALDQLVGDPSRIAVDVLHTALDHPARQQPGHQRRQSRHLSQTKADRHRAGLPRIAGGIYQNQPADARRPGHGQLPGQLPAETVAGHHHWRHLQAVEQRIEKRRVVGDAVVTIGERPGQAETRQVDADHPSRALEVGHPAFPGMQAGRGAMQQQQRLGIVTRALVAQVHLHAHQLDEL